MHIFTHLKAASVGKTGLGIYPDGMVEHDAMVGQLLDKLKALGLEDNTIVMYSTDNGAEEMSWPDGGTTPFRGEKATNWEEWRADRTFLLVPAQQYVGAFLATIKEFPPSQKVGSFSLDQAMEKLQQGAGR